MSRDHLQLSGLSAVSGLAQEVDVFIFHDVSEVKSASQSNKSKQENSSACVQNVCVCVIVCVCVYVCVCLLRWCCSAAIIAFSLSLHLWNGASFPYSYLRSEMIHLADLVSPKSIKIHDVQSNEHFPSTHRSRRGVWRCSKERKTETTCHAKMCVFIFCSYLSPSTYLLSWVWCTIQMLSLGVKVKEGNVMFIFTRENISWLTAWKH